ncbi:ABC transporter permease [Mesorhizobium sp. M2C.T.Ca.TU.002.02.1.1]|jgi:ribose transport system permease protein|uniref:Autoinducer 2 import system permease protein LsrC n=1 Tax=Mesorhizobium plurifarium TaxID=69974 RepID=A0A0K2VQP1_MESPL|nr:ABC transporter permease [Mesorhizobium sp. M2C.T.Ca.TU.002.02.1.1]RUU57640.1 ABC transporter permease [Mesorhizobium sp. M2C.T.Ca.TU.002.02.1.1]RUU71706.1 ABC transporter permease [Mesorhizobium sp. M2C.T.Ca.TU.009.01.2.1]CDX51291.1 Monosaccharide ABC transporter membrane protein, CUT2 family [Mesorhizobium plurifarium]
MTDRQLIDKAEASDLDARPPRSGLVASELVPAITVFAATALLIIGMKIANPNFGSFEQLTAILVTAIFLVVASFGQGLVILLGGIDLSLGVVIGVGGMMVAELTRGSNDALLYAIPLTLLCCLGIGLINGIGVAIAKIPPFIVTLASGITFFGVALGFTAGNSQQAVAPAVQQFMSSRWLGVPYPVYFIVIFAALAWLFQNRSTEGRKLYAIGSSPGAAQVLGLPIASLTITVYAISGLCAGITGILLAGYSSSATLDMGDALLMPSIAAVVIGGARVTGGSGIYLGTLAGALFLSTLSTVITTLSLSQGFRDLVQGGIIIIALLLQRGRLNLRSR